MSKSKRSSPAPSRRRPEPRPGAESLLSNLLKGGIGLLLVARLLMPTEASVQGDMLWVVQLWLVLGGLWAWNCWREGDFRVRLGLLDLGMGVLVAGHVLSALSVVATEGHKRAALNMLWEWVALGIAFFLIRQTIRTQRAGRRLLAVMVLATATLSGLGIWQHYVWYPQAAQEYRELRDELDRLEQVPPPQTVQEAADRRRQIQHLQSELSRQGIPLEGPGRLLLEERLQASSQPLGMFALANTFSGLLVAWLIVALGMTFGGMRLPSVRRKHWSAVARLAALALVVALIAYCLLLTKSRTAWVGLLAGLALWGAIGLRGGAGRARHWLVGAIAACIVVVGLLAAAALSGGFDREVVAEAPKSLRYRLEYWTGSWEVVRERPLLGTGPGNFRQHYLRHKAPESSEEIAEPHNFVFDVWTSGGLLALAGLLGLIVAGTQVFGRREPEEIPKELHRSEPQIASPQAKFLWDPLVVGASMSFLLVFVVGWLFAGEADFRLLGLMAGWGVGLAVLGKLLDSLDIAPLCLGAAGAALLVHLLGAGGIQMPAIVETLLILLAVGSAGLPKTASSPPASRQGRSVVAGMGLGMPALFLVCLFSASIPVLNRSSLLLAGDAALSQDRNPRQAERFYRDAADSDPFSPEPLERLAELRFQRWQEDPHSTEEDFRQAVRLRRMAIQRNPYSANGYRRLGQWHLEKFERKRNPDDARAAVEAFSEAVDRYPHHAALRAERAEALAGAGQVSLARREAAEALRLDGINRREGHRDKYLPAATVEVLQQIADPARD